MSIIATWKNGKRVGPKTTGLACHTHEWYWSKKLKSVVCWSCKERKP